MSTALSVVTELNFPLNGTMTAASATHKPITSHGTHRPASRPGGASLDGTALTAINSLLRSRYVAHLRPNSYRANLRRPLERRSGEQYRGTAHLPRVTTAVRRNGTESGLAFEP
nr:hypothetical protein GCM10020092_054210 [Actinoplanes digitatis]